MFDRQQLSRLAALVLVAGAARAATDPASDYALLDNHSENLQAALAGGSTGPVNVGYLLRTSYASSGDTLFAPGAGQDLGGFRTQDASLWFQGTIGGYEVFLRTDASDATDWPLPSLAAGQIGGVNLRDAWAKAPIAEGVSLYFGNFRCPVVNSGMLDEGKLLMIDRTRIGQFFDVYQAGAAVVADVENFHLKLAAQNGGDGSADELGIVARAEYKVGEGAKQREGALGAEGFDATFGLGYFQDRGMGNEFEAYIADAYATYEQFSLHAELVDMGGDLAAMTVGNAGGESATPYSATLGFRINNEFELAVRYQDLDDTNDTTQIGGGFNYYIAGHAAKWQVNVSQFDNDADDGVLVQVGLSLGQAFPNGAP